MKTLRIHTLWIGTLCVALSAVGCASTAKETGVAAADAAVAAALPKGVIGEQAVTATATVKALDMKSRRVTLEREDGSTFKFVAGPEVRNLPQVKVGDQVTVTYYESLAFEVKRAGAAEVGAAVAEGALRAKAGEMPGAAAGRATTVTTTITAIDKAAGTVTLRDPDGELTTVKVRHPEHLERVTVGDLVAITYTEALGIAVEHPAQ